MSVPLCPTCGGELVEIRPDGATCARGHFVPRDPATGKLRAKRQGNAQALRDREDQPENERGHNEERTERRSQADRLIGYALASGARFLLDQFGQPHVLVDGVPLALPRGAYPWLRRLFWQHEQRGATGEALQTAAGVLEALALHEGERTELHVRSAWCEQSRTLYVWLGPRRVLAIEASGWHVRAETPVLFRQYPTLLELPDPADGMTVEALADCLDLVAPADEAGRRLVTAWLATAWLPHVARPILLYTGDWGAGKTLRQRLIKRLLDPTKPESVRLDPRELVQKLMHCQVALLDNLGSLPEWAIDTLCRAVTGEADSKRRLYTDDEDVVFEFRRALLLNGINPPADRPDFTDRLLPVELERIPDTRRQEEATIWALFAERHGVWLGALATLLSRAIRAFPTVRPKRLPRLADWGRWAAAVYAAMGWGVEQFERDWALVVEKQQAAAVEGSPVAQAVLRFMADRHRWRGTASELLTALEPVALELGLAKAKGWPKSPVWLSRRLRELRPVLADRGIVAREEREGRERTRTWSLEHIDPEDAPEIPSALSLPSASGENRRDDADLGADGNADSNRVQWTIPSALLSARNPHRDADADSTDAADGISGGFSGSAIGDDMEDTVRQHRDELVAYLTATERHDVVERARSLLEAGAIPTRPLATALGRVENPQRVVRALVAVSRYRLPPESRAAVERELAAILAALRDGPEQPPTPDRTTEHPGNGHGDIARTLPRRRCSCGGMLEPSDHPGWLRCSRCRNYVRSDDPALGREKGVTR